MEFDIPIWFCLKYCFGQYHAKIYKEVSLNANHIGGVIDSVLVSSAVDCVCKL
jgi:hypothetical protein